VRLARRNHLIRDLQDRAEQGALLGACPPGLDAGTAAYRSGGFGTHEIVPYYELVRFRLENCRQRRGRAGHRDAGPEGPGARPAAVALVGETARLQALRDGWLETPDFEALHGRTPASVIACERARLPEGVTGAEAMIAPECPLCQMIADSLSPMFGHLDGCNTDDDFAISFHPTREAWLAERQEWEEFSRCFAEERESDPGGAGSSVWQASFAGADAAGTSPALTLFGLGARLAELTQDLKDAGAGRGVIDGLNGAYGNLRDAAQDPGAALVEPVIERLREDLAAVAEAHPVLADKCADLGRQLSHFARRFADESSWDEELPF
jgi:hypothetical protein